VGNSDENIPLYNECELIMLRILPSGL